METLIRMRPGEQGLKPWSQMMIFKVKLVQLLPVDHSALFLLMCILRDDIKGKVVIEEELIKIIGRVSRITLSTVESGSLMKSLILLSYSVFLVKKTGTIWELIN